MDKINLFLSNINKHITTKYAYVNNQNPSKPPMMGDEYEILESDYNSLEVRIAFHKLNELGVSLEFKDGKLCVKS